MSASPPSSSSSSPPASRTPPSSSSTFSPMSTSSSPSRRAQCLGQVILVEGNISAGKTTIARALGEELGYRTFFEPTQSNPYLENFYADPAKYALRMQIWLLKQRYNTYLSAVRHAVEEGQGVILDRSVFSDWVFAAKNLADGNIDDAGYAYYEMLRKQMLEDLPLPDAVLYLDVSPTECHRRIVDVRQRACESAIPLEYLQGLDECYATWMRHMGANGTTKTYTLPWEKFGDHTPILDKLRTAQGDLASPQRAPSARALSLLYSKDEIRKAQVLDHDLWSEDEHEHSLLDDLEIADIEQRAHAKELQERLQREGQEAAAAAADNERDTAAAAAAAASGASGEDEPRDEAAAGSPIRADTSMSSADMSGATAGSSDDEPALCLTGTDILGDEHDAAAAVLAQ